MVFFSPLCVTKILIRADSGFGALTGKKMPHNKFQKPNSNSF